MAEFSGRATPILDVSETSRFIKLASNDESFAPVATIDGIIAIRPGTKYMLRNITTILYIKLSVNDVGSATTSDIPIFPNESFVFWSDTYNVLHTNATTGVLTRLE